MNNLLNQIIENQHEASEASRMVHIFFDGQAWDLSFDDLDIGMLSSHNEIKNKVAEALDVPVIKLANFRVVPNEETEELVLLPNAQFGFINE